MASKRLVQIAIDAKNNSKGAFSQLEGSLGGINKESLIAAAGMAAVGAAVVATAKQLYEMIDAMAAVGDEFDKMSKRTGMAVENLYKWEFIVERGGSSIGALDAGLRKLARSMGDARDGLKEYTDVFDALGINVTDVNGNLRDANDVLLEVAEGLYRVESQTERMDLAQAILGRGGTQLLPALQEGRDAIQALEERVNDLGGTMSTEYADASAAFVDSQTDMTTAMSKLKQEIAEPFLAPLTAAFTELANVIGGVSESIDYMIAGFKIANSMMIGGMGVSAPGKSKRPKPAGPGGPGTIFPYLSEGDRARAELEMSLGSAASIPKNTSAAPGGAWSGDTWFETNEEARKFAETMEYANTLIQDGVEYTSEIEQELSNAAQTAAGAFSNAFMGITFAGQNAAQAIGNAFKRMIAEVVSSHLFSLMLSFLNPAGILGGAIGGGGGSVASAVTSAASGPPMMGSPLGSSSTTVASVAFNSVWPVSASDVARIGGQVDYALGSNNRGFI